MKYFAECWPDTLLVKALTRERVAHIGGKARLIKKILELKGEPCKGIIDEDPGSSQPPQLRNFSEIRVLEAVKLKIYAGPKEKVIIALSPRLEEWIISAAKESGLRLTSYNLPEDPDTLHKVINLDPRKLQKLLTDLEEKSRMIREFSRILRN